VSTATGIAPLSLPDDDWAGWLAERVDTALATAQEVLAGLKDGTARASAEVFARWNDADVALSNAAAITGVLAEVHPDEEVRALADDRARAVDRVRTDRGLDRALYEVVAATTADGLDPDQARFRERVLRDFRRSGVDRDDDTRDRLRAISERLTVLDQDFSRIVRDDVRSIRVAPERLAGLPADFVEAHEAGDDGLVELTTDYPDLIPVRTFASDRDVRRELTIASLNRGWPAADPVLTELVALRHEYATLLGYAGWPDYDAEVKMIGSGPAIGEFVDRITAAADAPAHRDYEQLLAYARQEDPSVERVDRADVMYLQEQIKRAEHQVDAQEVRTYFAFPAVRQGLLDVTGRLFDVDYVPVEDAPRWHEDVAVYDVVRAGSLLGRIHLDLHPRPNKYKHAAQFDVVTGVTGEQLPEGALVCNFPRGLMEHDHVVTLFHEFGHLVHHVLGGGQRIARFSGVATEWDFVEAPSQMLEEWAWDADVLQTFARNADGEPIPRELVSRMRAANEVGKATFVRTQMFYAALSYQLHRDRPVDITELVKTLQAKYDLFAYIPDTHFHASFGHLGGYSSGYYTYMWSLVIAKDLFSAFDRDDLFGAEVAHRYRDRILARGGSGDAADLVADFLGRPYAFDAYAAWLAR
jgi:thimet oligopeptidase